MITEEERSFLKMYRCHGYTAGKGFLWKNILHIIDQYLSPPAVKRWPDILDSLIAKGYIQLNKNSFYVLTKEGEKEAYDQLI